MTEDDLPKWSEVCDLADEGKEMNPIELFIFENEPPGLALQFRKQLLNLINWVSGGCMDRQNFLTNNDASK
jgi:hypothetical protein